MRNGWLEGVLGGQAPGLPEQVWAVSPWTAESLVPELGTAAVGGGEQFVCVHHEMRVRRPGGSAAQASS